MKHYNGVPQDIYHLMMKGRIGVKVLTVTRKDMDSNWTLEYDALTGRWCGEPIVVNRDTLTYPE